MIIVERLPAQVITPNLQEDFLELEWYEVNKSVMKRKTRAGLDVQLNFKEKVTLLDNCLLYSNLEQSIRVYIRPCLCILLQSESIRTIGQFCYDVGNRHLPIYQFEAHGVAVSYDGRLYQALQHKYPQEVQLVELKLLPENALKAFGNVRQETEQ